MRFLGRSLIALFLLGLTGGLLVFAGQTVWTTVQDRMAEEERSRPARERVFAVNVIAAEPQTIAPELRVFGEVQATRRLELRAPVGGTIVELADGFEEGGRVEEGQLLMRIDPSEAEAALMTAQADLRETEADLRDAERLLLLAREEVQAAQVQADLRIKALTRQRDLLARGVGSASAVETAELAVSSAEQAVLTRRQSVASAEARIDQAQTALDRRRIALSEAERRLAQTEVYADFNGTLSEVTVLEGGLVSPNERIATVIDASDLEVAIRLSTTQHARLLDDSGALRPAEVSVVLDVLGLDVTATGQVAREAPAVGENQTGRLVFARLAQAPGFRPGDFVEARIAEPPLPFVTRLPATAVNGQNEVLLVGDEDRLEALGVEVLRRQGDDVLVRARGLRDREVVAERTPLLGAGIKVRPIRPEGAAVPEAPAMVELDAERRARLIAFVEGNRRMPSDVRERILSRLAEDKVPAQMVERLESRMGG